jgi:hypothetical protein
MLATDITDPHHNDAALAPGKNLGSAQAPTPTIYQAKLTNIS